LHTAIQTDARTPVNLGLCGQSIIKAANITNVIVDGIIANSEMGK